MSGHARVALVTGGAGGIGTRICSRLASDGHRIAVNYATSADRAEQVVRSIRQGGGDAVAIGADVAVARDATALVRATVDALGPPSIVVCNAGVSTVRTAARMTPGEWDRVIAVNLSGAFYTAQAALPHMRDVRWGRIVFVTSAAAERVPIAGNAAYAAAKAGLAAMARTMAKEVAGRGITVNCVMPGFVDSSMTRKEGDAGYAFMERNWPLIPADAVASSVSFLASENAAHVSGEELGVWRGGPSFRP